MFVNRKPNQVGAGWSISFPAECDAPEGYKNEPGINSCCPFLQWTEYQGSVTETPAYFCVSTPAQAFTFATYHSGRSLPEMVSLGSWAAENQRAHHCCTVCPTLNVLDFSLAISLYKGAHHFTRRALRCKSPTSKSDRSLLICRILHVEHHRLWNRATKGLHRRV